MHFNQQEMKYYINLDDDTAGSISKTCKCVIVMQTRRKCESLFTVTDINTCVELLSTPLFVGQNLILLGKYC